MKIPPAKELAEKAKALAEKYHCKTVAQSHIDNHSDIEKNEKEFEQELLLLGNRLNELCKKDVENGYIMFIPSNPYFSNKIFQKLVELGYGGVVTHNYSVKIIW